MLIVTNEEWTVRKTMKSPGEKIVKDIKRATRKHYSSEEKIRIVLLEGLRGEGSIAELWRCAGISEGIYYKWSKDFMEAGKKRLTGDTARAANTDQCRHDDAKGSEVFRCGFLQDQLVQRKIRNHVPQPLVLFLKTLQFLKLFCAHSVVFLFPTIIGLFSHTDLPDLINPCHALPQHNFNLPQLNDNLSRLGFLNRYLLSTNFLTIGAN